MNAMVVGLSLLALAGSVAFAWSRGVGATQQEPEMLGEAAPPEDTQPRDLGETPTADAPSGPAVFEARCKRCHSVEEAVALVKKQAADKREDHLTRLLDRHFPPPPVERPVLVQYLLAQVARTAK